MREGSRKRAVRNSSRMWRVVGWGRVVREGGGMRGFERGGEQEHVHLCSIRRGEPSSTLFLGNRFFYFLKRKEAHLLINESYP